MYVSNLPKYDKILQTFNTFYIQSKLPLYLIKNKAAGFNFAFDSFKNCEK